MKHIVLYLSIFVVFMLSACSQNKAPLGSKKNPVKMYFVPSGEVQKIMTNGDAIVAHLEKATGLHFQSAVPTNYSAVIEAMGNSEADIAWLPTFAYVLAHQKYQVEPALKVVRYGSSVYRGQFVVRSDSGIEKLSDIDGKKVAYTDAASTSGCIYPSAFFAKNNIKPSQTFFAGGHAQSILAVYEGTTDVACSYEDARRSVEETYPDIRTKTKVIGFTEEIPNDSVSFRKDFPKEMRDTIVNEIKAYIASEEGEKVFHELYEITGFDDATDADYQVVRDSLKALGKNADEFIGE